ncbi:MAG: hypothetical protein JXR96_18160 [Deltaproteobacteria bacterium]|nr:hypothetical protein [Deltaproteobacteria bacterium]
MIERCTIPHLACLLLASQASLAAEQMDGFELWPGETAAGQARSQLALPVAAKVQDTSSELESEDEAPQWASCFSFGAGATVLFPIRLVDEQAGGERIFSDFFASWAPFDAPGEIGIGFGLGRSGDILLQPNLRFFFVKSQAFSAYLEGDFALLSQSGATALGGGAASGMVIGLMDHLALELRASVSLLSLQAEQDVRFFDPRSNTAGSELAIFPCVTLRVLARF